MQPSSTGTERRLLWIGFLTVATLLMTGVFACAVPFAALAALAAFDTERRDGCCWSAPFGLPTRSTGSPLSAIRMRRKPTTGA